MAEPRMIYLIRHGQTVWNMQRRLQGNRDSPLTDLGQHQARMMATGLQTETPSSILASPLGRARHTAAIIGEALGIGVSEDVRLSELRFGKAEGSTLAEIEECWPGFLEERERHKWHHPWPEGESYLDGDRRIRAFIAEKLAPYPAEAAQPPIAIVAHETINMILAGRLLELDADQVTFIGQPNHIIYRLKGRSVEHAPVNGDALAWQPGLMQKRSDKIIRIAA